MLLHITHTTTYHYTPQVITAQHMAHLLPRDHVAQTVHHAALRTEPTPAVTRTQMDVFGNPRTFFSVPRAHQRLSLTATSLIETHFIRYDPAQALTTPPWEQVRAHFVYHAGAPWDAATEFVFPSPYVQPHADFGAYAQASFTAGQPILVAACDLMTRIHHEFTYQTASTDINTPAHQALTARTGVCQDFAHILISCLRTLGLAARYVSGYLLTEVPPGQTRLIGSDASHAWVSVYVPNVGAEGSLDTQGQWFDLDPTNNRWGLSSPGIDYVTLAIGRDYGDVSPLRGVIHGGAHHTLEVAVTVQPANELSS